MKKSFIMWVFALFAAKVQAQPLLTMANCAYQIGDTLEYYYLDTTSFMPGASGAGVTWDFTLLTTQSAYDFAVIDPSTIPSGAAFPTANRALYYGASQIKFYSVTPDSLAFCGDRLSFESRPFNNERLEMPYPFGFGNTYTDHYHAAYSFAGTDYEVWGDVDFTADAYGTLMLPGKTINNVLRVKSQIYQVEVEDLTDTTVYEIIRYNWYVQGTHGPVLSWGIGVSPNPYIVGTMLNVSLIDGTFEFNGLQPLVSLYPNPVTEDLNFTFEQPNANNTVKVHIYGITGEKIHTQEFSPYAGKINGNIDMVDMASGIYILQFVTGSGTSSFRLIKD